MMLLAVRVVFTFVFCGSAIVSTHEYSQQLLRVYSELKGACKTTKDCRSFGYVCKDNHTCECDEMYKADAYKKQCVGGVDQKCVYDEHCIEGAYCMNQAICKCKDTTPVVLEEGMVCARSSFTDVAFVPLFYLPLAIVTLIF